MKINEIIVESHSQLDEGMMDTMKSKLSGLYQMASKKIPNFDAAFAVAKSHKAEINDIIKQLMAKKETGKVSKEDIIAAITPLSKKVAAEVGGKNGVNEGDGDGETLIGTGMFGAILGTIIWLFSNDLGFLEVTFWCISLGVAVGIYLNISTDKTKKDRLDKMTPEERVRHHRYEAERKIEDERKMEQQSLQREYDRLEQKYKNNRYDMSYTQTRRMEELYNQGFR